MFDKIKEKMQDFFFPKYCKFCEKKAVVVGVTYDNEKVCMCSNCLRGFRFREKEYFKSILPYGENK